jgi:hypothetical protein
MGDSDDGIITRSLMYLFEQLGSTGSTGRGGDGCRYSLRASFAEIYNEQIFDLVRFDKKQLQVGSGCCNGWCDCQLRCAAVCGGATAVRPRRLPAVGCWHDGLPACWLSSQAPGCPHTWLPSSCCLPAAALSRVQVRWDTSKGFHMPDLLCKECATLEDTLRVRCSWAGLLGLGSYKAAIWLPLHLRQAAAGNSPAAAHPRATLRCFHFLHCSCPQCVTADPLPACACLLACLQLLSLAVRHRRVGSHELNMESSRSHSIFTGGARAGGGSWRLAAGSPGSPGSPDASGSPSSPDTCSSDKQHGLQAQSCTPCDCRC